MGRHMKTLAIVQARMGSIRFPNKVMLPINGVPMIELVLHRLSLAKLIDHILVATSTASGDKQLAAHVRSLGYEVFEGSENNVLDRFYNAAQPHRPTTVVRITGDCPLVDPELVDTIIAYYALRHVDYLSNGNPPTFPDGLCTEVFTYSALEQAARHATTSDELEHVTPYIRDFGRFKTENFFGDKDYSHERWSVDEPEDLVVVDKIFRHFSPRITFGWLEVISMRKQQLETLKSEQAITRNEGRTIGSGQKLWKRAKRLIPGGNMLLSKRAEMFLPDQWPAYFSKAKGCKVWDLDGREFIDMSIMGIGTNTLGYGHPEVDDAVRQTITAGNMSTLNCPEEVFLAEKLVELHPWAAMVRFARSGGEANAIAIRIARAASGKDKVAFCGYHGWHDWYLSANLGDEKGLDGHLLPGLEPNGVPRNLRGSVLPFSYNNFAELEALVSAHDIGVIKMEVARSNGPQDNFLHKVRQLATDRGIVLIFDECTSGFRQTFGGLHKLYGVEPDMAMFGKALGNGYAITGTIGRREVMEAAQSTFISSTFWTERIGPTAALKTLEVMERMRSWELITQIGLGVTSRWKDLAMKHGLSITTSGLPALTGFSFSSPNTQAYKTLLTQEMLLKGYLASTSIYVCTDHNEAIVDRYFDALDGVFQLIQECENGRDVETLLKGPVCHNGFRRLN